MLVVDLNFTQMAKFMILLVFVCFQEELVETENIKNELINEIPRNKILDGADEDQWFKGEQTDNKSDEDWKEEDEKWLQEIQSLLEDDDEDYDDDPSEAEKLMGEIEKWIKKTYPEKSNYKWLLEIGNWFDKMYDDDWDFDYALYPDIVKKEKNIGLAIDKNDNLDLYYSWLYRIKLRNSKNEKARSIKRFSSV